MTKSHLPFSFSILIMALFMFSLLSGLAKGSQPEVTLQLDNEEAEVDVGPGSSGIANFTGTVTCDMRGAGQNVQAVDVTLHSECVWASIVAPSSFTFVPWGEKTAEFEVKITVPNFTPTRTMETVIISGTANTIPGPFIYSVEPVEGIIKILPYTNFILTCERPKKNTDAGNKVEFQVKIMNRGNYEESFNLRVSKSESNIGSDWNIMISEEKIVLEEFKEEFFSVIGSIPKSESSGTYLIVIEAIPGMEGNNNETMITQYRLFVKVKGGGVFGLGYWSWYALFIILGVLIGVVGWKRKAIYSRFKRKRKKRNRGN